MKWCRWRFVKLVAAADLAKYRGWEADFTASTSHVTKPATFPWTKTTQKPVCSWIPFLGLGPGPEPRSSPRSLLRREQLALFPSICMVLSVVQCCSWERRCWPPPQGAHSLQRSCFTRAKARAGVGKFFSSSWASVSSHGFGQWLFLFNT